ncbi:hypothetical protein [Streptomyces sp. NPDC052693]|uniref:hypothetical protein n=1 Tax=Streptomyces sp. NPDC052693 TaxID=3155814 RepID=UPI0034421D37
MDREQILTAYQRQLERIESSRTYSDHAKRVMSAKAYKEAQGALDQLRQAEVDSLTTRRTQLQRRMFGHEGTADANTVIARRDANDRAAKLDDPRIAQEALHTAQMEGDALMAQAIATRAAQYGWSDVLGAYAGDRPGFQEAAQEYSQLPDPDDWQWKFHHTGQFLAGPPSNLYDASASEIERLAQVDLDAPEPDNPAAGWILPGTQPALNPGDVQAANTVFGGDAA